MKGHAIDTYWKRYVSMKKYSYHFFQMENDRKSINVDVIDWPWSKRTENDEQSERIARHSNKVGKRKRDAGNTRDSQPRCRAGGHG